MELRQLDHFIALAEELHFTRAARRLNVVQSALSASISILEVELGAKLFHRTTRQVRITAAGAAFYEKARIAQEAVRQAKASVVHTKNLQTGHLAIGVVQSLSAFLDIPTLLADFHARYPAVRISLRQDNRLRLVEQVADGRCDLALLPVVDLAPGVEASIILDEPMVMACAPGQALSERASVSLEDLSNEVFIDFSPGWGSRSAVDAAFGAAGVSRRTIIEVNDLETLLDLVARGLGKAIVPSRSVSESTRLLSYASLAGVDVRWRMMVAYATGTRRSDDAPAARAFLQVLDAWRLPAP
jgi:DNA-binding transcriptional LysR family regulator